MNILIIEDDIQMLKLYRDWLSDILVSFSFKDPAVVSFVTNGKEADYLLDSKDRNYDITFLDIVLPGMSGVELYNKHLATMGDVVISSSYVADLRNKVSSLLRSKGVTENADSSGTGTSQKYKII